VRLGVGGWGLVGDAPFAFASLRLARLGGEARLNVGWRSELMVGLVELDPPYDYDCDLWKTASSPNAGFYWTAKSASETPPTRPPPLNLAW
jgi:hypothetical protein